MPLLSGDGRSVHFRTFSMPSAVLRSILPLPGCEMRRKPWKTGTCAVAVPATPAVTTSASSNAPSRDMPRILRVRTSRWKSRDATSGRMELSGSAVERPRRSRQQTAHSVAESDHLPPRAQREWRAHLHGQGVDLHGTPAHEVDLQLLGAVLR